MSYRVIQGEVMDRLREMPDDSVHCCVTSPPYWGLRDYGVAGQIGMEKTPEEYVARLVEVFAEVRRVLRADGTLWLNLGDCFANDGKWGGATGGKHAAGLHDSPIGRSRRYTGLKPKDLIGIPWRVAFALQSAGWWLRSDIIWSKPNPMPESVTDRCTRSHEYIFHMAKSQNYYCDMDAIKEPGIFAGPNGRQNSPYAQGFARRTKEQESTRQDRQRGHSRRHAGFNDRWDAMSIEEQTSVMRNKRSVWNVSLEPFSGAHFAVFPTKLIEPCILAGCPAGGTVLDTFSGSGTVGVVSLRHGRNFIGIELNSEYVELSHERIMADAPLLNKEAV